MSDEQKTPRRSNLSSSEPEINRTSMTENPFFSVKTNARNVKTSHVGWPPGDGLDFAKATSFPQKVSSGASESAGVSSELVVENIASIFENPHFLRSQFPFTSHAKIEPTSEIAQSTPTNSTEEHRLLSRPDEDSSSCGQNVEKYFSNQRTSSGLMKDISKSLVVLSGGLCENVQKPGDGLNLRITTPLWNNNVQGAAQDPSFLQSQFPSKLHERRNVESSNATMNSHSFRPHAQFESPFKVVMNPHGITDGENLLQLRPAKNSSVNATMNSNSFSPDAQFELPFKIVINPYGITDGKNLLQLRPEKNSSVNDFSVNATMNSHSFRPHAQFESPFKVVINPDRITDGENLLQLKPAKDSSVNDFYTWERNTDKYFSNANLTSDQMESMNKRMEFLSIGQSNMLQENDRFLSSGREDKRIENYTFSSRTSKNHFTQNTTPLDIANKLQQKSEGNDTQIRNPDFIDHLSLKDISFQYYELYHNQTFPVNHDYAMNIMAYIEILNDYSWTATFTCFDENVKNLVKNIWNEIKDGLDRKFALQIFDLNTLSKLVAQFDKSLLYTNYNLNQFIKNSVIMSQIGVMARKRNIKEAPLYVIDHLRKIIMHIEYYKQISFESWIVNYAEQYSKFYCKP